MFRISGNRIQLLLLVLGMGVSFAALLVCGGIGGYQGYLLLTMRTRFERRANEATGIVEAVYRYRHATGLWPQRLEDAGINRPPGKWLYVWSGYDEPYGPDLRLQGPLHMTLHYWFPVSPDAPCEGWVLSCEGNKSPLAVDQPVPKFPPLSHDELLQRIRRELERRSQIEPENVSHRKELERIDALEAAPADG